MKSHIPLHYFDKLIFYPPALKPSTLVLMGVSGEKKEIQTNRNYQILLAKQILTRLHRKFSIQGDYIVDDTPASNLPNNNNAHTIIVIKNMHKLHVPALDASIEERVRCILANHKLLETPYSRFPGHSPAKLSFI